MIDTGIVRASVERLNPGRFISMGAGGEQRASGMTMAEYDRGKAVTWLVG